MLRACRIRKDLKTAFEVRKLSRRGSMERGEADLGRVFLPMKISWVKLYRPDLSVDKGCKTTLSVARHQGSDSGSGRHAEIL